MKALGFITCLLLLQVHAFTQEVIQTTRVYKWVGSTTLSADLFYTLPSMPDKPKPAIAFFHGGGWTSGSPAEFHQACRRFAKKGFVAVSFQYRLSVDANGKPPHPDITPVESVKDARSAIRWLRKNADSLQIDPDRIVVGGQSAGGQLTLATALVEAVNESSDDLSISPVPNAMLLYSGCVNTIMPWCDYLMPDQREALWTISPYHNLKKGMPPVIAFHGKKDETADYWTVVIFQRETKKLGNYFELISYENREHYLGTDSDNYFGYFDEEIMERTDDFLVKFGFMEAPDRD